LSSLFYGEVKMKTKKRITTKRQQHWIHSNPKELSCDNYGVPDLDAVLDELEYMLDDDSISITKTYETYETVSYTKKEILKIISKKSSDSFSRVVLDEMEETCRDYGDEEFTYHTETQH
tara:strand:+ start:52 stop:408 length:357 start_codon:yes stop_codon:yes gene_type:complete